MSAPAIVRHRFNTGFMGRCSEAYAGANGHGLLVFDHGEHRLLMGNVRVPRGQIAIAKDSGVGRRDALGSLPKWALWALQVCESICWTRSRVRYFKQAAVCLVIPRQPADRRDPFLGHESFDLTADLRGDIGPKTPQDFGAGET
jgi:hypothetical protein